jgi:hypothetical protein
MKKIYTLVFLSLTMLKGWGQQLMYEPFNYTPSATSGLAAQSNSVWKIVNTGDSILVDNGSLSYTGLPTSTGNKAKFDGGGTDYYTDFTSQTTGSVYSSFVLNVSSLGSLGTTGGYFTGFIQSGSTSLFGATVWTRLSTTAGRYNVGISTRSNSAVIWLATDLTPGTPCFIVAAYDIVTGTGNDVCRIWLNTSAIGGSEPAADATSVAGTDLTSAARLFLRQDNTANTPFIEIDEMRVGTTWASVTPSGAPTPTLSAIPTTVPDFGNINVGSNSTSQSFALSGANLTGAPGNITVTAPSTDFQVSNDNSTWGASTTVAYSSATLASTNVYVRFIPQSGGFKSGNVSISGGGATAITVAVSGTGVVPSPLLNATPTTIPDFGNVVVATNSSSQSFTVSGANLTGAPGNITITAPPSTDFQVSNDNSSWGASTTIPYTTGTLANTTVYVRFTPQTTGFKSGNVTVGGGGATTVNVAVSGTGTAAPVPTITTTPLTAFGNICTNATGGPNSFTINGTNLTTANVTVGALAGYTFSTTSGGTYTASLSLAQQTGGTYTQTIFVKFIPTAVQSYNGNIPVAGGGVASPTNVAASGAGVNTAPGVTTGAASSITFNSATAAGSITATGCTAVSAYGIEYSTTNGFPNGSGTQTASTNLSGGNFSSNLTGLAPSTAYYYKAYATNGGGTSYGAQQTFTTAVLPIALTATPLTAFGTACTNATAGPNSFTINGVFLTNANVNVGPLTGFTFATTANGTYALSLSLTQPGGTYTQIVYVKFNPTAVQFYNGNIPVTGGGAASINVAASGSGVNTPPTVTTGSSSNITNHDVVLEGRIPNNGCTNITSAGIEFSGIRNFANGTGVQEISANLAAGVFSVHLDNLVQGTKYYYRAWATNNGGIAYGAIDSFTVTSIPNGFTFYPVPSQRGQQVRITMSNLASGYYGLQFFDGEGRLVRQFDLNIQSDFINQLVTIPGTFQKGIYQVRLISHQKVLAKKRIFIF